jgi:hypothetical protein
VEPDKLWACDEAAIELFPKGDDISGLLIVESTLSLLPGLKISGVKGLFAAELLKLGFREC